MDEAVLWLLGWGVLGFIIYLIATGQYGMIFWLFVFPVGCFYLLHLIHLWNDLAFNIGFILYLVTVPYVAISMAFD